MENNYKKRSCLCKTDLTYICKVCDYAACDEHINFLTDDNCEIMKICSACVMQFGGINNCTNLYQCYMLCDVCNIFYKNDINNTYFANILCNTCDRIYINHKYHGKIPLPKAPVHTTLLVCKGCYLPSDWNNSWGKLKSSDFTNYSIDEKILKTEQNIKTINNIRKRRINSTFDIISTFFISDIAKIICEYVENNRVIINV